MFQQFTALRRHTLILLKIWRCISRLLTYLCVAAARLELNGRKRRLTWEATPRSIHDGVQAAINTSDCLIFDTNVAQLFADNGNLSINVTIYMC